MSSGHPLTDSDREPWLQLIRTTAEYMTIDRELIGPSDAKVNTGERNSYRRGVVISCSALKRRYRDTLRQENQVMKLPTTPSEISPLNLMQLTTLFVHIEGTRDVLMDRMTKRIGHFMKVSMLDKQLETLEDPVHEEGVIVVSMVDSTEDQVRAAQQGLRRVLRMETRVEAATELKYNGNNFWDT